MIRHLFLDLEDTIIAPVMDGWPQTQTMNEDKVRAIIEQYKPDQVHLFSFAVWNQFELRAFNLFTRPQVERTIGRTFDSTWTVDDHIIPMCCKQLGLQPDVDFSEMTNFWSKHQAFRLCMMQKFAKSFDTWGHKNEVLLLDDVVMNETFHWPDLHVRGQIANIDNLPEPFHALNRPSHA